MCKVRFCPADEFRSKVGCENDVLHLSCNPHSRVAIYSAQYGRTEYDSIQCPQPRGMKEESEYPSSYYVPYKGHQIKLRAVSAESFPLLVRPTLNVVWFFVVVILEWYAHCIRYHAYPVDTVIFTVL